MTLSSKTIWKLRLMRWCKIFKGKVRVLLCFPHRSEYYSIKSILIFNLCFQRRTVIATHLIESKLQNNLQKKLHRVWIFFFFKALLNSRSLKVFISNELLLQFLQANKRRRPHCVDQISRVIVCYCNGNHSCTWKHRAGASMIMASCTLFSKSWSHNACSTVLSGWNNHSFKWWWLSYCFYW